MKDLLRKAGWALAIVLFALLVFSPQVRALAWLNVAQVQRFNGDGGDSSGAFAQALALDPGNAQIRWQAGEAQANMGDAEAAWATLRPLEAQQPLDGGLARLMLTTLFAAGHDDEAVHLNDRLTVEPSLPPGVAAHLANAYLSGTAGLPAARANDLLAQALGLDVNLSEYNVYEKEFTSTDFWETDFGKRMKEALLWRSQSVTSLASDVPNTPGATLSDLESAQGRVASLLGVSPSDVRLGEEMVANGGFERHDLVEDRPSGWLPIYNATGGAWDLAAFMMGADNVAFSGQQALHIEGLRIERLPDKDGARAGFQHAPITLRPGTPYTISFVYRTQDTTAQETALWLTFDPQVIYPYDKRFPPTDDEWRRVTLVGWNRADKEATIAPMLRLWSEGSVWFDDFSVRPLVLTATVQPGEVKVAIESVSKPK